jgi:phenylacetate-CoA ligase
VDTASLESLYLRLPAALQHAACSAVGWRTERTRYGPPFERLLDEARARSGWSDERLQEFRDARLRRLVVHAAETVPYYARLFAAADLDPHEIRTLAHLEALPILTKAEAQDAGSELQSRAVPAGQRVPVHTSGTTGAGLHFTVTLRTQQEQWATWWRYREWHGLRRGVWCGLFAGRSVVPVETGRRPFWRLNVPGRQVVFSGYHMSPRNLPVYVEELRRRRLPWLHGYPSLLALLAGFLLERGANLGYRPRWVTTGAENLLPQQAAVIERAFGVRPRQHYGLTEAVANASECERGLLHVDEDFAAVELVDGADGTARVVGTSLTNPATPLLRYDTGDLAVASACGCGRPGRVLARVDGRLEDYVVLADGTRLGRLDHVFKDMVNIREAQIRQRRPGELRVLVVRGGRYGGDDDERLSRELRKRVGQSAEIAIEHVERLERSPAGKLRFVVSELEEGPWGDHVTSRSGPAGAAG